METENIFVSIKEIKGKFGRIWFSCYTNFLEDMRLVEFHDLFEGLFQTKVTVMFVGVWFPSNQGLLLHNQDAQQRAPLQWGNRSAQVGLTKAYLLPHQQPRPVLKPPSTGT